ncbi:zinc dependent phospholipase C family protein [Deferribacterales bacterium Es71-Z0220]|uniref:zinc dependent phospholipase C family protein n=1 Tax=Deferrivibrio essentukiensis TaxID=2880922 RepID=UPI001F60AA79|nr:zinc dependent phospholipase C family protein [Deferrivibrio essentukiensis]MCB4203942.1 zinc dependent phospholipase C family protein [Deferrivibrio essentukiensis]
MLVFTLAVLISLVTSADAFAWGFETHISIGIKILENSSFHIINNSPAHFLLGNIFPDLFNLFKNFSTLKKSLNTHSWNTVSALFSNAATDAEKAFAYGYAAHLSADIVAHNYFVPEYYISRSDKKLFAHFLTENAEEALTDKKFKPSLFYLLDNASELGSLFLRTKNVEKKYFSKQIKYIKFGLNYQYTLNIGKISKSIRQSNDPDFISKCEAYQQKALEFATTSVENGFGEFVKYDPSGHKSMQIAKNTRQRLVEDMGKKNLNSLNFNKKKGL